LSSNTDNANKQTKKHHKGEWEGKGKRKAIADGRGGERIGEGSILAGSSGSHL
jgi:hypothetical protein